MEYTPSEAEKRFEPKGVRWCNMVLFDAATATEVIRACEDDRIPLLGIEGFRLGKQDSKEVVYASTADILDLSFGGNGVYDRSLAFVSDSKREGMHFEFVFGD